MLVVHYLILLHYHCTCYCICYLVYHHTHTYVVDTRPATLIPRVGNVQLCITSTEVHTTRLMLHDAEGNTACCRCTIHGAACDAHHRIHYLLLHTVGVLTHVVALCIHGAAHDAHRRIQYHYGVALCYA